MCHERIGWFLMKFKEFKNNRGQALVEFLLIFPIVILLIMVMIDVGMIVFHRNQLETEIGEVVAMIQKDQPLQEIESSFLEKDIVFFYHIEENLIKIQLTKDLYFITPGLSKFLPSTVTLERNLGYES